MKIIERTITHEGGYVFNPADPGGESRYGITKRNYPALDIKKLTKEQAVEIYRRDYYDAMHLDGIHSLRIRFKVFDIGVSAGPVISVKMLQGIVGAKDNGVINEETVTLVNAMNENDVLLALLQMQLLHYGDIVSQQPERVASLKGWINRAFDLGEGL
jgi:lysozyme family protein